MSLNRVLCDWFARPFEFGPEEFDVSFGINWDDDSGTVLDEVGDLTIERGWEL